THSALGLPTTPAGPVPKPYDSAHGLVDSTEIQCRGGAGRAFRFVRVESQTGRSNARRRVEYATAPTAVTTQPARPGVGRGGRSPPASLSRCRRRHPPT